jgi:hypothetical protein
MAAAQTLELSYYQNRGEMGALARPPGGAPGAPLNLAAGLISVRLIRRALGEGPLASLVA